MANVCFYNMTVIGSKSSCVEWVSRMRTNDITNCFRGFSEVYIDEEGGTDDEYYMKISGDCAFALHGCFLVQDIDLFAVNTQELGLDIEANSYEPMEGFKEHYIYKHGKCTTDECIDVPYPYCHTGDEDEEEWHSMELSYES